MRYPFHTLAYTVGLRKTCAFSERYQGEVLLEVTNLEGSDDYLIITNGKGWNTTKSGKAIPMADNGWEQASEQGGTASYWPSACTTLRAIPPSTYGGRTPTSATRSTRPDGEKRTQKHISAPTCTSARKPTSTWTSTSPCRTVCPTRTRPSAWTTPLKVLFWTTPAANARE